MTLKQKRIAELRRFIEPHLIREENGAEPRRDEMGKVIVENSTCGTCGLTWNDALITQWTPAPSARCPYEYIHAEILELRKLTRGKLGLRDEVGMNEEQGLYTIPCDGGFSCLGFDVCRDWTIGYAKWAGIKLPEPLPYASIAAYVLYRDVCREAGEYAERTNTRCPLHLTPELVGLEGKRVEVVDAYGETVRFYVGKSTGWAPCHLQISRSNSDGGPAVMGEPFKSVRVIGGQR